MSALDQARRVIRPGGIQRLERSSSTIQRPPAQAASRGRNGREWSLAAVPPHAVARAGTSGAGSQLPYADAIQRAFGKHDVSGIRAHFGDAASAANRRLDAQAYTYDGEVAFGSSPSLHTAAHEAAHAVQQRQGVRPPNGIGRPNDVYERRADEVAARVVRGESGEDLLDATPTGAAAGQLQRKAQDSHYGTFEDVYYNTITNTKDEEIGCELYVRFTPNDKVDASLIGLTQAVRGTLSDKPQTVDKTKEAQSVTSGAAKGFHIDQYAKSSNPLYATSDAPAKDADKMTAWSTNPITAMTKDEQNKQATAGMKGVKYNGLGQHGYRKKSGKTWDTKAAELDDWPTMPAAVGTKKSSQLFETTALAIEGTQKDTYYGSVQWGWQRDDKGTFSLVDFKVLSMGTPTSNFMQSATKWNASKTSGGDATLPLPVSDVYTTTKAVDVTIDTKKVTLPVGTRVQIVSKPADAKSPWQVTIVDGPSTGSNVAIDGTALTKE